MPWSPLQHRADALPLILAGPIVRRAAPGAVTVWVALRAARTVTLRVFAWQGDGGLRACASGTRPTVRLGDHLHVVAVTARPQPNQPALLPEQVYCYDLSFAGASLLGEGIHSFDPSPERRRQMLTYGDLPLPSFVLPPADLNHLRLVHGSCRNLNGEGPDALAILDQLLADAAHDPAERPQLLFLTGDQIYADGVGRPLLAALMDAGAWLFAGNEAEALPGVPPGAGPPPPGERGDLIGGLARLTTNAPGSHLMTWAEYCAMYLFSWSDALWPAEFPRSPTGVHDTISLARAAPPAAADRSRVAQATPTGPHTWQAHSDADADAREVTRLEAFRRTLPHVRRALANVPTYMIFDDHDISDDWYLDGAWCAHVLGNPLGRRIIRNALLAYCLFQGWGNDPDQFTTGSGAALLAAVHAWRGDERAPEARTIAAALGQPGAFDGAGTLPHPPDALRWHYRLTGERFQILVLDTRTHRQYDTPGAAPGLLSRDALCEQIGRASRPTPPAASPVLTFVVSPTPVVGVDIIEKFQFLTHLRFSNYAYDREAWSLNRHAYQRLLRALAALRSAVVLSGDVHYGFGSSLEYWEHTVTPAATAKIVNFTSSSLRNRAAGTQKAILTLVYPRLYHLLRQGEVPPLDFWAWDSVTHNTTALRDAMGALWAGSRRLWWALPRLVDVLRAPADLVLPATGWPRGTFADVPPDRTYRLRYLRDVHRSEHTESEQYAPPGGTPAPPVEVLTVARTPSRSGGQDNEGQMPAGATAAHPHVSLRAVLRQTFRLLRWGIGGHGALEHELGRRQTATHAGQPLQPAQPPGAAPPATHLVSETNLGEVRCEWTRGEVLQRLWCQHPDPAAPARVAAEYRAGIEPPDPSAGPTQPGPRVR